MIKREPTLMSLHHYLERIRRTDALIRRKSTGPPAELASKLDISERWLYVFLDELRQELDCPIEYCRQRRSYVYARDGKVAFEFQPDKRRELTHQTMNKINGGFRMNQLPMNSEDARILNEQELSQIQGGGLWHSLLAGAIIHFAVEITNDPGKHAEGNRMLGFDSFLLL